MTNNIAEPTKQFTFEYALLSNTDTGYVIQPCKKNTEFRPAYIVMIKLVTITIYDTYTTIIGEKYNMINTWSFSGDEPYYYDINDIYDIPEDRIRKTSLYGLIKRKPENWTVKPGWYMTKEAKPFTITTTESVRILE